MGFVMFLELWRWNETAAKCLGRSRDAWNEHVSNILTKVSVYMWTFTAHQYGN